MVHLETPSHKIRMQIPQANIFARAELRCVECICQYCPKLFGNVRDKVSRMLMCCVAFHVRTCAACNCPTDVGMQFYSFSNIYFVLHHSISVNALNSQFIHRLIHRRRSHRHEAEWWIRVVKIAAFIMLDIRAWHLIVTHRSSFIQLLVFSSTPVITATQLFFFFFAFSQIENPEIRNFVRWMGARGFFFQWGDLSSLYEGLHTFVHNVMEMTW